MAKPICYFTFNINDLSVQFSDRSSGINLVYAWDFGFKVGDDEVVSNQRNPLQAFPAYGVYFVSLKVSNTDGYDIYFYSITIGEQPSLFTSVLELVNGELPGGLALELNTTKQLLQKWQLFFQGATGLSNTDVYNETKYGPMWNVLISKLILRDLMLRTLNQAVLSPLQTKPNYQGIETEAITISDYERVFNAASVFTGGTMTIAALTINGFSYTHGSAIVNLSDLLTYLNSLSKGIFIYDEGQHKLQSLGNPHIITVFNYVSTNLGGQNGSFTSLNERVVPISGFVESGDSNSTGKGPLKRIETGPSNAEWFDASIFWKNLFDQGRGDQNSGFMGALKQDICMYAYKVEVHLSICTQIKTPVMFRNLKFGKRC